MDPLPLFSSIRSVCDDVLLAQCRARCCTRACSTLQQRCSSLLAPLSELERRECSRDAHSAVDLDLPSQLNRICTLMQDAANLMQTCADDAADAEGRAEQFAKLREEIRGAAQAIGIQIDEELFSAKRDEEEEQQDRITDGRSALPRPSAATGFAADDSGPSPATSGGSRFFDEPPADSAPSLNEAATTAAPSIETPRIEVNTTAQIDASAEPIPVASRSDAPSMSSGSVGSGEVAVMQLFASPTSAAASSSGVAVAPNDVAVAVAATSAPPAPPAPPAPAVAASSASSAAPSSFSSAAAAAPAVAIVLPDPVDDCGRMMWLPLPLLCTALCDHMASPDRKTELSFARGERLRIDALYVKLTSQGWVIGRSVTTGKHGHFPAACVITDVQAEEAAREMEQQKLARDSQPAATALAAGFADDPSITFKGDNKPDSFLFDPPGSVVGYDEARADLWTLSDHGPRISVYSAFASASDMINAKIKPHHSIDLKDEVHSIQSVALDRRPNAPTARLYVMGLARKRWDSVILCIELNTQGGASVASRIRWPNSPSPDSLRQGSLTLDARTQRLFVSSDPGRLTMLSLEGAILAELVGQPNTPLGGPAAPRLPQGFEMGNPSSMVVDEAQSRLFVADLSPSQILVFHSGTLQYLYSFGRDLTPEESSLHDLPAGAFASIDNLGLTLQSRVLLIHHKQQFAAYTTEGRFLSYINFHLNYLPTAWAVDPQQQHPLTIFLTPPKLEEPVRGCCVIA